MSNYRAIFSGVLAAAVLAGANAQPVETLPVLPADGKHEVLDLSAESRCLDAGKEQTVLRWALGELPGLALRIDISIFYNGFDTGRFDTFGPLAGDAAELTLVNRLEPGTNVYWRVLTRTPNGWIASSVGRNRIAVCPKDD